MIDSQLTAEWARNRNGEQTKKQRPDGQDESLIEVTYGAYFPSFRCHYHHAQLERRSVVGITTLLAGASTLFNQPISLPLHSLSPRISSPLGNGLAAFAIGQYYILAALQENMTFFLITVPLQCFAKLVFWDQGGSWRMLAAWEGTATAVTALALVWEGVLLSNCASSECY